MSKQIIDSFQIGDTAIQTTVNEGKVLIAFQSPMEEGQIMHRSITIKGELDGIHSETFKPSPKMTKTSEAEKSPLPYPSFETPEAETTSSESNANV